MSRIVEPLHARPRPPDEMARLFAGGWPEFIFRDRETKRHLGRVRERFRDLELALVDEDGAVVAAGWGVPLRWDGRVADLPAGYNDSLARSLGGDEPDTLAVLAVQVRSDRQGRGCAGELLTAFRGVAGEAGWPRVICPVRPAHKARYPLTPIERYLTWTRPDRAPLDPWIRTHWRLGARVLAAAQRSQVITGSVGEWEAWTSMIFPDTGEYVIPEGLSTLHIDREAGAGVYVEPNVWMQHR